MCIEVLYTSSVKPQRGGICIKNLTTPAEKIVQSLVYLREGVLRNE